MKLLKRQKIWLAVVILVNLGLWLIPSDVVEQIARDRQTMLGRYSRAHFTWIVVVAVLTVVSLYVDWSRGAVYRRRWFQVLATAGCLLPALLFVDFFLRSPQGAHYVREGRDYHRPPNAAFHVTFEDKPKAHRTYPDPPPGYGTVPCTLHTDARGYRNRNVRDRYDVVVLGDSFAEGSNVSDEDVWPVRLARRTDLSVYNLGMSGYAPFHYLESLKRYGPALRPRLVLCLLYEGNDFRSARRDGLSKRLELYFKQSPIRRALDRLMIRTFGPIRSHAPVRGIEILDWLPLAIPEGPQARYYTFAPKQLRDLYRNGGGLSHDRGWLGVRKVLAAMKQVCEEGGGQFAVVFAPTKAHVVLPLVADRLPARKVRAFTAISERHRLPEGPRFLAELMDRIDGTESTVRQWCRSESIAYLSLTECLRAAAERGTQVYYTYNQHWTPEGHRVVAETIGRFLVDQRPPRAGVLLNSTSGLGESGADRVCHALAVRGGQPEPQDPLGFEEPQPGAPKAVQRTAPAAMVLRRLVLLRHADEGHRHDCQEAPEPRPVEVPPNPATWKS